MSSPRKTKVPAIPTIGRSPNELHAALGALKEATEVGLGRRGDPLDRFATIRDLSDAGIAGTAIFGGVASLTAPPAGDGDPGATPFDPGDPDFGDDDYTVPPAPQNVTARGVPPNSMMVTWSPPDYGNHNYAEVFAMAESAAGVAPTFDQMINSQAGFDRTKPVSTTNPHNKFIGPSSGTIFMHKGLTNVANTGESDLDAALNPTKIYYWVRFISRANVPGPFSTPAAAGQMAIDPGAVLDAMTSNIRASAIYSNLRAWMGTPLQNQGIGAAGGVRAYIAQQDGILQTNIDAVEAIIGSPQAGENQTVYSWIHRLHTESDEHSQSLEDITTWQAALSHAVDGAGAGTSVNLIGYYRGAGLAFARFSADHDLVGEISVGDTFTVASSRLPTLAGATLRVGDVFGNEITVTITADNDALLPIASYSGVIGTLTYGSVGGDFLDFIGSVYQDIWVNVTDTSAIGRSLNGVRAEIGNPDDPAGSGTLWGETQELNQAFASIDGKLENIWSVNMRQQANGLIYTAGFGLSLETTQGADGTFESTSTFLVNANQFAIMGTGAGSLITGLTTSGVNATVTVANAAGWSVLDSSGQPAGALISGPEGDIIVDGTTYHSPFKGCSNIECTVTSVSGNTIRIATVVPGPPVGGGAALPRLTFPPVDGTIPSAIMRKFNAALLPPASIPFIVDTRRGAVGIRGKLIVDGLIAAKEGQFQNLTAYNAFITNLQADVVNANVVIGQRIIAGTPGSGALDANSYNAISNFIVELNNPSIPGGPSPMRYWKPSTGQTIFELTTRGDVNLGGNLAVGRNAVFSTTSDTGTLLSIGGSGVDNDGSQYPLWIGPKSAYGSNGLSRSEANALFYVKDNGRAGFNSSLFLGDSGLMLPALTGGNIQGSGWSNPPGSENPRAATIVQSAVSTSKVKIKATRLGTAAKTLIIVSGTLATQGGTDHKGYLMKATLTGSAATNGYDAGDGFTIIEHVVDDFPAEVWPFTMMGVVEVPAGEYYVRLNLKTVSEQSFSIIKGWQVFSMQVV